MGPRHVLQGCDEHHRVPRGKHSTLHHPTGRALQGRAESRRGDRQPVALPEDGGEGAFFLDYVLRILIIQLFVR